MKTSYKQIATRFNIEQRTILSLIEKYKPYLEQLGPLKKLGIELSKNGINGGDYHLNAAQEMFLILNMKNTTKVLELKLKLAKESIQPTKTPKPKQEVSTQQHMTNMKTEHAKLLEEIEKGQQEIYSNFTNYKSRTGITQVKPNDNREHAPF